jgi:hypothetical protein
MTLPFRRLVACPALVAFTACSSTTPTAASSVPVASPATAATIAVTRSLGVNDVSVLFPLGHGDLWAASSVARDGQPLLPRSALDLPGRPVIRELQGPDATYAGLRVVSLRFDPCFSGNPCYPQIRLVFQGLAANGTSAFDGALHALYNLTPDEFAAAIAGLRTLSALAPENERVTRLEVSPALLAQGMTGPYAAGLRDLVNRFIGASNLAKFTFMTRQGGGGDRWDFGGFNLKDFQPGGAFPISGIDGSALVQTVRENGGRGPGPGLPPGAGAAYNYSVTPDALHGELALVLSSATAQTASSPDRQRAMDALARVENPSLENPDTVDCAVCHLANRLRGHLETTFALSSSLSYTGGAEATRLVGGAERDNENLRGFGYFNDQPAISQRVANETIRVLSSIR